MRDTRANTVHAARTYFCCSCCTSRYTSVDLLSVRSRCANTSRDRNSYRKLLTNNFLAAILCPLCNHSPCHSEQHASVVQFVIHYKTLLRPHHIHDIAASIALRYHAVPIGTDLDGGVRASCWCREGLSVDVYLPGSVRVSKSTLANDRGSEEEQQSKPRQRQRQQRRRTTTNDDERRRPRVFPPARARFTQTRLKNVHPKKLFPEASKNRRIFVEFVTKMHWQRFLDDILDENRRKSKIETPKLQLRN